MTGCYYFLLRYLGNSRKSSLYVGRNYALGLCRMPRKLGGLAGRRQDDFPSSCWELILVLSTVLITYVHAFVQVRLRLITVNSWIKGFGIRIDTQKRFFVCQDKSRKSIFTLYRSYSSTSSLGSRNRDSSRGIRRLEDAVLQIDA